MVQLLSTGETHRVIDREIGTIENDLIGGAPSFTYARYDLQLVREHVDGLVPNISDQKLDELTAMDEPKSMQILYELAGLDAANKVDSAHFPSAFDLFRVQRD